MNVISDESSINQVDVEVIDESGDEIRIRWPVFLIEGFDTSDNGASRYITPGAIDHRALPLSLMGQPYTAHGGQEPPPAEVMGKITALTKHPGPEVLSPRTKQPYPDTVTVWSGEGVVDGGHRFADLVRKQYLRGTSADLAATDAELVDEDTAALSANPRRRVIVNGGEIAGATLLPIPAFGDAYCELVDEATVPEPLVASAFPAGMWLQPQPPWRSAALGDHVPPTAEEESVTAAASVNSPARSRPPVSCFTDPGFTQETPITIEDCGAYRRVYGNIGVWDRPHIGFNGKQIYIPRSRCDYAEFLRGGYRALDEDGNQRIVAVGHLTMDTGHADLSFGSTATAHHYDHTGSTWADVAVGEDAFGPWVNGIVRPHVTEEQLDRALASPPSGDWRPIGGALELVAVLCVNTPGFGVYRARVASGVMQALVASSLVQAVVTGTSATVELDYEQLAEMVAIRVVDQQQHIAELTAQRVALLASLDDSAHERAELLAQLDAEDIADLVVLVGGPTPGDIELAELFCDTDPTDDAGALKRKNWVEKAGGLPKYFTRIKKHLMAKGMDESRAIATAVNVAKKMCSSGDLNWPGLQKVNPGSRAEACAAVADWERKKAQSHAS